MEDLEVGEYDENVEDKEEPLPKEREANVGGVEVQTSSCPRNRHEERSLRRRRSENNRMRREEHDEDDRSRRKRWKKKKMDRAMRRSKEIREEENRCSRLHPDRGR